MSRMLRFNIFSAEICGWKTHPTCFRCPKCATGTPSFYSYDLTYPDYFATLVCQDCSPDHSWVVCTQCTSKMTKFGYQHQLSRHASWHKSKMAAQAKADKAALDQTMEDADEDEDVDVDVGVSDRQDADGDMPTLRIRVDWEEEDDDDDDKDVQDRGLCDVGDEPMRGAQKVKPCIPPFGRRESKDYFAHKESGAGEEYLVMRSQTGSKILPPDHPWGPVETELGFATAEFLMTLSRGQRETFAKLNRLHERQVEAVANRGNQDWRPRAPASLPELRSQYMEGQNAFLKILPHPRVYSDRRLAYTSILECIQDLLAHGIKLQEVDGIPMTPGVVACLGESARVQELYSEWVAGNGGIPPDRFVILITWNDDYESNYAKTERGTPSLKASLTISPDLVNNSPYCYTYPLMLGDADSPSVEVAQKLHNEELSKLMDPSCNLQMYCGKEKRYVTVGGGLVAILADQPARRKYSHLQFGNGKLHGRFGFSFDHLAKFPALPSCDSCRDFLRRDIELPEKCVGCYSWFTERKATRLSFDLFKEKAAEVHERIVARELTSKQGVAVLAAFCITEDVGKRVCDHAANRRAADTLETTADSADVDHILEMMEDNPDMFDHLPTPASWDIPNFELHHFVEAVMHLLFLGIVKQTLMQTNRWLAKKRKWTAFSQDMCGRMEDLEALALEFCKARSYGTTGKFGGKVSENYLADARVLPWLFANLPFVAEDPEWVEPKLPVDGWLVKDLQQWLKVRRLPHTAKKAVLLERVKGYMAKDSVPPVAPPVGGPVEDVLHMLECLTALIGRLMATEVTGHSILSVKRHIRMFLDAYEVVDRPLRETELCKDDAIGEELDAESMETDAGLATKKQTKPGAVSHYNFLCLPNLVAMMERYGSLRNLWEGGFMGEAGIKDSKAGYRGTGYRSGWWTNLMLKELRLGALRRIRLAQNPRGKVPHQPRRYTVGELEHALFMRKGPVPLSAVRYFDINHDDFHIVVRDSFERMLVDRVVDVDGLIPLVIRDHACTLLGLDYFIVQVTKELVCPAYGPDSGDEGEDAKLKEDGQEIFPKDDTAAIDQNCIFLPLLPTHPKALELQHVLDDAPEGKIRGIYAVITDKWQMLSSQHGFVPFQVTGYDYSNELAAIRGLRC